MKMLAEKLLSKPSAFDYDDYRVFLADLYTFYKETTSHFSYRYFSMRAGFKSPNFLKLVIEGKRNLSPDSAQKFSLALRLNKPEAEFFQNLVLFCQSRNSTERSQSAREILKSRTFKKIHPLKQAEMKYYAHWYYIPVRELVATLDFVEEPKWIASQFRFHVSEDEVIQALKDLEQLNLIKRDESGRLQQTNNLISSGDDVTNSLVSQYHREMISRARESIDEIPGLEREISGTCISCTPETVAKIKTMVREFRKEILALADEAKDASLVYQLNFQLFPLAGKRKPK